MEERIHNDLLFLAQQVQEIKEHVKRIADALEGKTIPKGSTVTAERIGNDYAIIKDYTPYQDEQGIIPDVLHPCEKCGAEIKNWESWKKICGRCYAIQKQEEEAKK